MVWDLFVHGQIKSDRPGCKLLKSPNTARRVRARIVRGGKQPGCTTETTCGDPRCVAPEHVYQRRWKSFGGKWGPVAKQIAKLEVGQAMVLDQPNDKASIARLRCGIGATRQGKMLRVSIRSLKGTTGICIIRQPDWN